MFKWLKDTWNQHKTAIYAVAVEVVGFFQNVFFTHSSAPLVALTNATSDSLNSLNTNYSLHEAIKRPRFIFALVQLNVICSSSLLTSSLFLSADPENEMLQSGNFMLTVITSLVQVATASLFAYDKIRGHITVLYPFETTVQKAQQLKARMELDISDPVKHVALLKETLHLEDNANEPEIDEPDHNPWYIVTAEILDDLLTIFRAYMFTKENEPSNFGLVVLGTLITHAKSMVVLSGKYRQDPSSKFYLYTRLCNTGIFGQIFLSILVGNNPEYHGTWFAGYMAVVQTYATVYPRYMRYLARQAETQTAEQRVPLSYFRKHHTRMALSDTTTETGNLEASEAYNDTMRHVVIVLNNSNLDDVAKREQVLRYQNQLEQARP